MGLAGSILDHLDQVGDWGLLATDADLVVTRWNRWLERRSGRPAADVVGRPLFEALPDLARRMERYYRQALTGQTVLLSQRLHKFVVPLPAPPDAPAFTHQQQAASVRRSCATTSTRPTPPRSPTSSRPPGSSRSWTGPRCATPSR